MIFGDVFAWLTTAANWTGDGGLLQRIGEHLWYTLVALAGAALVAVPAGLAVGHTGRGVTAAVGFANAMRALPTLGVITLLSLQLGVLRTGPVLFGLALLAVPPILAGAYAGVQSVDRSVLDASAGVGMTRWQQLWQVEVPTAMPLLLGGLRGAVLQVVATTTVAAFVGLGGLGRPLLDGQRVTDYPQVAGAALVVAALAVLLDVLLAGVQRLIVPRGLRVTARTAHRPG
ncbi:MAG TPA: ABC transporter permease subunit [Pseudonocardiaceae bacterium]|nr:ABC transporter permease subunit [Pseudonocardiaceae bacterium]